jgi:hypothetical protein
MRLLSLIVVIFIVLIGSSAAFYLFFKNGNRSPDVEDQKPSSEVPPLWQQKRTAENLAEEWIQAMNEKDTEALARLAYIPFYFDNKPIFSSQEVKQQYRKYFSENVWLETQIRGAKAATIAELKGQNDELKAIVFRHFGLSNRLRGVEKVYEKMRDLWLDRALNQLQMTDEDFIVIVSANAYGLGNELISVFLRGRDGNLKIAGMET